MKKKVRLRRNRRSSGLGSTVSSGTDQRVGRETPTYYVEEDGELPDGAEILVEVPPHLLDAELKVARWHTWGTFVNILGVAVGLFSMTLATRWGSLVASSGLAFMAFTVVIYGVMRIRAGQWEVQAIEQSHKE